MREMAVLASRETPNSVVSFYTVSHSDPSAVTLSSSAIIGVTIAGSVFLFLAIVGPVIIWIVKRRSRLRADTSSLSLTESGYLGEEGGYCPPRRLHKRDVTSRDLPSLGTKGSWVGLAGRRLSKRLTLPHFPSLHFPRFEMFSVDDSISEYSSMDGTRGRSENEHTIEGSRRMHSSPEKHRGYVIQQNRRKTSWIDEDALHGPRISPTRSLRKKMSWFTGNGLTRSLSRRLSLRLHQAPELAHSPTLPCTGGDQRPGFVNTLVDGVPDRVDNSKRRSDVMGENEMKPRFYTRRPLQRGGSLANDRNRIVKPGPHQIAIPPPVHSNVYFHSDTVINAAQQLAGSARVPSVDLAASGRRYSSQTNNTDAELQAILRRTAERLQDGNRSSRRQTLVVPSSPPSKIPGQMKQVADPERAGVKGVAKSGDTTSSPTKNQRDAPSVTLPLELERHNLRLSQGPGPNDPPWQTHRRSHARRMSHVSQISQVSRLSDPDSQVMTPSRCSSQTDVLQTALPSPVRLDQASPSHSKQIIDLPTYSPVSDISSALSTLYSEEEDSPPISILKLDSDQKSNNETDAVAPRISQGAFSTLHGRLERKEEPTRNSPIRNESRPQHSWKGAMGQAFPNTTQNATLSGLNGQVDIKQQRAETMSKTGEYDPFTTHPTSPSRSPKRLSQVSSTSTAKLPARAVTEQSSPTLKRSQTRRHIMPPPHRLSPGTKSQTPNENEFRQYQSQSPTREPRPVAPENRLSSGYGSYQYSQQGKRLEHPQLSIVTKFTPPQLNPSPTKAGWGKNIIPHTSLEGNKADRGTGSFKHAYRQSHSRLDNAVARTQPAGPRDVPTTGNHLVAMNYTVEAELPRVQPHRNISTSGSAVSDLSGASVYSQDDNGADKLSPLTSLPIPAFSANRREMRVASAVAQLRRMDSQVSCVSGYSTTTGNIGGGVEITSPTLPALRGGGCSPGKRGVGGGTKNYLALGGRPRGRDGESQPVQAGIRERSTHGTRDDDGQDERRMTRVEVWKGEANGTSNESVPQRDSVGHGHRRTVMEGFENDLNRARQVLRESRGHNLPAISGDLKKRLNVHDSRTHVAKSDEGRASLESLGIYDEKGFLRSPTGKKGFSPHK